MKTYGITSFFTNTIKETLFDRVVLLLSQVSPMHDECSESLFVSIIDSSMRDDLHQGTLRRRVSWISYYISYISQKCIVCSIPSFLE
jgi:hypothetical protein